ncbi:MAG: hypothetical protein KJ077_12400 [Anaerolineae bacterium]|nr:hypothetical protein [Anaerolineae bacterium]
MSIKRRLAALECYTKPKPAPPTLKVERRDSQVWLFFGRKLIKTIKAQLWDAL